MSGEALPILAFKLLPRQFELCGGQSFISIRDQAVRVRTLLWAMESAGHLAHMEDRKVLVVGAGYAGVSAALWLAKKGIDTWLVEPRKEPFSVQLNCSTRYLSLTQYDWPASHFDLHAYPQGLHPDHISYPWLKSDPKTSRKGKPELGDSLLSQDIRTAREHAEAWSEAFESHKARLPKLNWLNRSAAEPVEIPEQDKLRYRIITRTDTGDTDREEDFAYAFYTRGFGEENTTIGGKVQTRKFWQDDELALADKAPPRNILISGAGDGALQDIIRVLVDPALRSASEVLDRIQQGVVRTDGDRADWALMLYRIQCAEDQAMKAFEWYGRSAVLPWSELHARYRMALAFFTQDRSEAFLEAIASVLQRRLPCERLTHVMELEMPGRVYALNRFLYLLLCECLEARQHSELFGVPLPMDHVRSVVPKRPTLDVRAECRLDLKRCIRREKENDYRVKIDHKEGLTDTIVVDELVLRHGLPEQSQLFDRDGEPLMLDLGRIRLPYAALF